MKIGVISDTHIPSRYLEVPLQLMDDLKSCDLVIHAGDFDSWDTYMDLKERLPIIAVCGNGDDFNSNEEVPEFRILEIEKFRIGVIHGWGPARGLPERIRKAWEEPVNLLIFGHSHSAIDMEVDGIRMLNPGSATDTITAEKRTYAIINLGDELRIEIKEIRE